MSVRKFIGASSTLLLAWLGATYFHQVPPEKYKVQGRLGSTVSVGADTTDMIATVDSSASENR